MADTQAKREIRRERVRIALDTAVDGETIMLDELAKIWGVGKPAFVNIRDTIPNFPPAAIDGKTYFYPRVRALSVLDAWEKRHDVAHAKKSSRIAALIGIEQSGDGLLSLSDLTKANQLRIELEERMRTQGLLVAKASLQTTAGKVYEILSRGLSNLGTILDPNGQWPADQREAADKAGDDLLLRIHAEMKHMLESDAASRPPRSPGNGGNARRSRPTPVSGQRGKRVAKPGRQDPAAKRDID